MGTNDQAQLPPNAPPSSMVAVVMGMGMPAWPEVGAGLLSRLLSGSCSLDGFIGPDIRRECVCVCVFGWCEELEEQGEVRPAL